MTPRAALVSIHLSAVLFGLTGVFGELIQGSAFVIVFGRAALAVVALTGFAWISGRPLLRGLGLRTAWILAGAGLLLAGHWATFFHAVKVGGIAIATLGFASFPAFIALLEGLLFRERTRLRDWLLVGLVTVGLVLVTPSFDFDSDGTVGLTWAVLSGFLFALLALANRYTAAGTDPVQVACWQNVAVALYMLPLSITALPALSTTDWLWMVLLGVLCTGLSHYLFVSSLTVLKARVAGLVIALEPVYAIAFAWVLFSQQPTLRMLAGGALILAAVAWPAPAIPRRQPDHTR